MYSRPVSPSSPSLAWVAPEIGAVESISTTVFTRPASARVDGHRLHATDIDAQVTHGAAIRQAADRAVEINLVLRVIAAVAAARIPPDERDGRRDAGQRKDRDRCVFRVTFHGSVSSSVLQHAATRAVEILTDPGVVVGDDAVQRIHDDFLVDQHGDTITCPCEGVQIVRDHDDRQAECLAQVQHEFVERRRGDRIETGRRLVQEQQHGIEGERARQRSALDHAARQLRWKFCSRVERQTDHAQPQFDQLGERGLVQAQRLDDRQR